MTPEKLRAYWLTIRDKVDDEIMERAKVNPKSAFNDATKLAALHFLINQSLDTFKAQG